VIGLSSFKGWQEAVVDVNRMVCMPCTEILTEDLHIPEQPDQFCSLCWVKHWRHGQTPHHRYIASVQVMKAHSNWHMS